MSDVKQYTPNLNLTVIPVDSTSIAFLTARDDVFGNKPTSNMQIIDTEVGNLKKKSVYLITGESVITNQYTATNISISALSTSFPIIFIPDENNTGAATLTINSLSSKYIKKYDGLGVLSDLSANDLITNNPILMYFDFTNDAFILTSSSIGSLPASSVSQSGIVMLTNDLDSTSETLAPTAAALKSVADDLNTAETAIGGKAPTSHADANTTYGVGTSTLYGHAKLYNATGANTDGAITQGAATTAITGAKPVAGTGISVNGTNLNVVNIIPPTGSDIGGVKAGNNVTIAADGTISIPGNPTELPPSGTAGGDLSGTYPNPTIKDGAADDTAIGVRTFDQSIATAFASNGTLTQLGSWIVKVLKSIIGGDNWYDTPASNINTLNTSKANATHATQHATGGADAIAPADIGAATDTHDHDDVYAGITHATQHASDGSDPITPSAIGAAASSHNQAASTISAGILGGQVVANATAVATISTSQVRNISAGSTDLTAGTSALTTGDLYFVYE